MGKNLRLVYYTLSRLRKCGGVKLVDIVCKQKSLQILSIFQSLKDEYLRNRILQCWGTELNEKLLCCNISEKDVKLLFSQEILWNQALAAWASVHFTDSIQNNYSSQILWLNSHIRINKKPVLWKEWINKGLLYVNQILDEEGKLLPFDVVKNQFNLNQNDWMRYTALTKAVPKDWFGKKENVVSTTLYDKCVAHKSVAKFVYRKMLEDKSVINKYWSYWDDNGVSFDFEDYELAFAKWHDLTKNVKLRDFQYRLLLCKIFTNVDLKKWGLSNSDRCTFCKNAHETLAHLLFTCKYTKPIINDFTVLLQNQSPNKRIGLTFQNYITNNIGLPKSHVLQEICLITKQWLYRLRCRDMRPTRKKWVNEILMFRDIQMFNAKRCFSLDKEIARWSKVDIF